MRQKPSFSGIQQQQQQRQQPLATTGKKPAGGTSLAALMNQYDENDFSTISLKMNNEASRLQVQVEERSTGLGGYGGGGDDWFRKQQQSPIRTANKENINEQPGHRKKSVVEVNRFADCVREIEKNKHYGDASQDQELAAFQPRLGGKSPLRTRTTTVTGTPTSSLLRHAEEDLVFRAKGVESNKPVNFTDLSKRFNGGIETTPTQLQKQPQTRSKSKLAPKIMKQFQESDESEHDSEAVSLKESISQQKSKMFKFHSNMRPEQKEELERKVHQIKEDNLRVLADKKNQNGNKVLPRFVEDIKVNVAREIEEFARNLMGNEGKMGHHYLAEPEHAPTTTHKLTFHSQVEDPKRKKIFEETKTHIRELVDVKEKKLPSFEEEDLRHMTIPTQPPKTIFNARSFSDQNNDNIMELTRQRQFQEEHEMRERLEEQRRIDEELLQKKLFEEEQHRRKLEEEDAFRRERAFQESERLRIQQEQKLRAIQFEQARIEQQRVESDRRMREHQREQERFQAEQARLRQLEWEEAQRRRERQFEDQQRRMEEERAQAERNQLRIMEEERAQAFQIEQARRIELARKIQQERLRIQQERAQAERVRLQKLEEERQALLHIQLTRKAEEERLEAELERQRIVEQEEKLRIEFEQQRRYEEEQQLEEQRLRQLREEEELRVQRQQEQERLDREMAEREAEQVRERLLQQKQIEAAREKQRLEYLQRQQEERRERLRQQHEEHQRLQKERIEKEREQRERQEREQLSLVSREPDEGLLEREQRQRQERLDREQAERTRLEEQNRERIRIKVFEENIILERQMLQDTRRLEEDRAKNAFVPAPPPLPITVPAQPEELRTSLKVESLFTSYSIFQHAPEPDITPEDRINKLFDKARNEKPVDMDFKFDFNLNYSLDGEEEKQEKRVTFDESTLNSRDRLPFGSRRK